MSYSCVSATSKWAFCKGQADNERGHSVVRKVLLEYIKIFYSPKEEQPSGKMGKVMGRQFSEGADKHTRDHFPKRLGDGGHSHDVRFHPDRVSAWQGLRAWLSGAGVSWAGTVVHPRGGTV